MTALSGSGSLEVAPSRRRRHHPAAHAVIHPRLLPQALDKVISLIDPSDDQYVIQRALVNGDAAFYVTELLADATAGAKAAEAVAAVCRHAAPSMARLATGPLVGLDSSVERVSLNPCQSGALQAAGDAMCNSYSPGTRS